MKTKTKNVNYYFEKNENVTKILAGISGSFLVLGLIGGLLYIIFDKSYFELCFNIGLTLFLVPFFAIQIAMPANIGEFGTKNLGAISLLFFLILFPFIDACVLAGVDSIFHIFPNYHLDDFSIKEEVIEEYQRNFFLWVGIIYFSLISIGLIIRMINNKRNKK